MEEFAMKENLCKLFGKFIGARLITLQDGVT